MDRMTGHPATFLDCCPECGNVSIGWYPEGRQDMEQTTECPDCGRMTAFSQGPALSTMN